MTKKKSQTETAKAIRDILRQYKGLVITVHTVKTKLADTGLMISRPTIRKYLLQLGCTDEQQGLYSVPMRRQTNEQQPTA